ncbi:hypothetical protein EGW08_015278 [Elysia chlorotica]|uniref:Glycosyl transferase family 25 domain-containing protein n=1 Tax=Elysia chlorotica TaxID=188477 RepID=A0A433T5X6_ELYCH|nr:hypothetical protein EGW08_015278 [Elysia chlorotica]
MALHCLTCRRIILGLALIFCFHNLISTKTQSTYLANAQPSQKLLPTVVISTIVRNKAHALPWFLGLIESLDYPKDRIALWIHSDHNIDNTTAILKEWLTAVSSLYHSVEVKIDEKKRGYTDESSPLHWSEKRMHNVMKKRQNALEYARKIWADYIFMVDADVVLENNKTLQILMAQKRLVIGPMLNSSTEGYYSNFWGAMSEKGYYIRSDHYANIVDRDDMGVFPVPMVHTAVLIDLHHWGSPYLSYIRKPKGYTGPDDDIIIFAHTVKAIGETMHVINSEYFGRVMLPLNEKFTLEHDQSHFDYIKLESMVEEVPPLYSSPHVYIPMKPKDKLGFDEVYMINLKRRPARRFRMMKAFEYLGIDAKIIDAVDGKELNDTFLEEKGIKQLPGFADPYHGRAMKMGEIGCFLSHYQIWQEVVEKNYEKVVVFEDDVRFELFFRSKLASIMNEVEENIKDWDLIYLGRKRLQKDKERMVEGSSRLAWPHYSYWTISYLLSNRGARKLLAQEPLGKMVPVDEYLPIMFDKHPETEWRLQFSPRDMLSLSADPFLVYPTHYTGEANYFSDTEDSVVIDKGTEAEKGGDQEEKQDREEAQDAKDSVVDANRLEPEAAVEKLQAARTKQEL